MLICSLIYYSWEWVTDLIRNMTRKAFESTIWILPDMKDLTCEYIFTYWEKRDKWPFTSKHKNIMLEMQNLPFWEFGGKKKYPIWYKRRLSKMWFILWWSIYLLTKHPFHVPSQWQTLNRGFITLCQVITSWGSNKVTQEHIPSRHLGLGSGILREITAVTFFFFFVHLGKLLLISLSKNWMI